MNETWETKISTHGNDGNLTISGYKLEELIEKLNFTQSIFLVLKGDLPNEKEERLLNAILVSSIDHGVEAPSTTIARLTASNGVSSATAIANGVAAIGESHGGAAEALAKVLQEDQEKDVSQIIQEFKEKKKRIPGFGHKIYETDPRTTTLLKIAHSLGFHGKYVTLALEIQNELEKSSGKKLPLNIDGAIAALMSEMGFDYRFGKSLFIISRVVGIAAHVHEEQKNAKPVRRISSGDVSYSGPEERNL